MSDFFLMLVEWVVFDGRNTIRLSVIVRGMWIKEILWDKILTV